MRDVLAFRLGLGMDFAAGWPQPLLEAMDALGMGGHNRFKTRGYRTWRDAHRRWHTYRPDGTEIAAA